MPFTVSGPGVKSYFDRATDEAERQAVFNFLVELMEPMSVASIPMPGSEIGEVVSFIPATELVATYLVAPNLRRVFVERIEPLIPLDPPADDPGVPIG